MSKCSGHYWGSTPHLVVSHRVTECPPLGKCRRRHGVDLQVAVGLERRKVMADGRAPADSSTPTKEAAACTVVIGADEPQARRRVGPLERAPPRPVVEHRRPEPSPRRTQPDVPVPGMPRRPEHIARQRPQRLAVSSSSRVRVAIRVSGAGQARTTYSDGSTYSTGHGQTSAASVSGRCRRRSRSGRSRGRRRSSCRTRRRAGSRSRGRPRPA